MTTPDASKPKLKGLEDKLVSVHIKWAGVFIGAISLIVAVIGILTKVDFARPDILYKGLILHAVTLIAFIVIGVATALMTHAINREVLNYALESVDGTVKGVREELAAHQQEIFLKLEEYRNAHSAHLIDFCAEEKRQAERYTKELFWMLGFLAKTGPVTHIITWSQSRQMELSAQHVLCMTNTLEWVAHNLDLFLRDMEANPSHKYCYVVYDDEDRSHQNLALKNADIIRKKLPANFDSQFQILFLREHTSKMKKDAPFASLPLPGDVAIYERVAQEVIRHADARLPSVVAISTVRVSQETLSQQEDLDTHYDIKLDDPALIRPILHWFHLAWNTHKDHNFTLAALDPS